MKNFDIYLPPCRVPYLYKHFESESIVVFIQTTINAGVHYGICYDEW